jgi:hypothetical protein
MRVGAHPNMPGMMDTVLNLGLIKKASDEHFTYGCHGRFIHMYGDAVL